MKLQLKMFLMIVFISFEAFSQQYEFSPVPNASNEIIVSNGSQYIYIVNKTGSAQSLNLDLSQSGMSISSNRCTSSLANNQSCYFILSVNQSQLPFGDTIASLNKGSSLLVKLKFSKQAPIEFSEFSSTSVSLSDFSNKVISIKNKTLSSKSYSPSFSGTDASKFEILLNRCSSSIAPNVSCQITYRLKPQMAGSYSAQLTESSVAISADISASIASNVTGVIKPVIRSLSISSNSLDYGTLYRYGVSSPLSITITNTGNTSISPIFTFSSKMNLILNRCSSILAGQSCVVSLGINPDSSTPNGAISGQSVNIKAQASDSGENVSVAAILNVTTTACAANQHTELGSCVSNIRSCSIPNGVGSQSWSSGSWGSCAIVSCDSEFYNNLGLSCNQITYSATFGNYSPNPASVVTCDGAVTSNRSISSCLRDHDFTFVDTSKCTDINSSIVTQSPAGNINVSISNGSETRSCSLGSSSQSFVSRTCDSSYHDSGSSCDLTQYIPLFSTYSPEIPTGLVACDGTVVSNRSISECRQQHDNAIVSNSLCSDPSPSVSTLSPSGTTNVSISNGSEIRSCSSGSTIQSFVSRSCDSGYHDGGSSCDLNNYVPTFSSYSPEIPTGLVACDGTVVSDRSISECRQQHDNALVSNTLCSDSTPSVTTQSPAGNKIVSISNGTETKSCDVGSTSESFVSRSCDSGYHDDGSSCDINIYVPTFSSYLPAIPTGLVACDGTVVSNRSISECRQQHDNAIVSNGLCSDPTPSVSTLSPSGNKIIAISNGTETNSCAAGSTSQVFVSRSCNLNFIDNGLICEPKIIDIGVSYSQSGYHSLTADGKLYLWGDNGWGSIGNNSTTTQITPFQVNSAGALAGKTVKQMSTGIHNTCVVASDDLAYCWGSNLQGSLGIGSTTQSNVPVAVNTSGVLSGKTIKKILAVVQTTCALASDNQVYCWGRGLEGQLGNGASVSSNVPVAVSTSGALSGKTVVDIYMSGSGSTSTVCAKTSENRYYCWGDSGSGLKCGGGSNSPGEINMSGALLGKTITQFIMVTQKTFIITSEGKAYGCGANNLGQLGINSTSSASLPTQLNMTNLGARTIKTLSASSAHGCLTTNDDLVFCWGQNTSGKTGVGLTSGNILLPTAVDTSGALAGKSITKLSTHFSNTMALSSDGKVYGWGEGFYGANGDGSNVSSAVPLATASPLNGLVATDISVGSDAACALTSLNKLYCWGRGQYNGISGGNLFAPNLVTFP